ncbi:MAG: sugar kinase [Verrucomicrobia bacterium]|nr:sugar kinase [Verrucomicrobiota bacterium]
MSGAFEVMTFGEAMILLSPLDVPNLEMAGSLHLSVGGAEANAAIGLARLGHTVTWVSRLGADPLGTRVLKVIRGEDIDVSRVEQDPDAPTGLMFKEVRPGNSTKVLYYRRNSAAAKLRLSQFAGLEAKYVLVTGITPALSRSNRELTLAVVDQFRAKGTKVVFDPNMRFRLWSSQEARPVLLELARRADILLPSQIEAELLTETNDLDRMRERLLDLGPAQVAIKLGGEGARFADGQRRGTVPPFMVPEVDPVGAGDAFCAGVISGLLDELDFADAVRRGAALGAFCVSCQGDYAGLPTRSELETFLTGRVQPGR